MYNSGDVLFEIDAMGIVSNEVDQLLIPSILTLSAKFHSHFQIFVKEKKNEPRMLCLLFSL